MCWMNFYEMNETNAMLDMSFTLWNASEIPSKIVCLPLSMFGAIQLPHGFFIIIYT